ncbi:MAG: DNA gyrase inhibitor YacG [Acetobacteraceae bacterium]|nr:DNA gyrase inhibitor YacG [Acetobacteraceae bacterium]
MPDCPICGKPVVKPTPGAPRGAYPFCSDRCRQVDLGRWFDGRYAIPAEEAEPDEDDPRDGRG